MAEGDGSVYNNFKEQILLGELDLGNGADTIKVMLVTGHSLDIDTDASYSDVSGDEESGTGYTAGGETLTNQAVAQDNSNNRASFDADNVTWTGLDVGTPNYAIMYDDTHASKYLIAAWEIATASNGGDYTLQWNANGILLLT
jgi:hypothetical protein